MDEEFPDVRRSIRFWAGIILAAVAVFAVWFEGVIFMRPQTKTQTMNLTTYSPIPPNEIKQLVAYINGPPTAVGFIKNIQVPAARRLESVGPQAKSYGAVQALTALVATTNDPEAKAAAEAALKSIGR